MTTTDATDVSWLNLEALAPIELRAEFAAIVAAANDLEPAIAALSERHYRACRRMDAHIAACDAELTAALNAEREPFPATDAVVELAAAIFGYAPAGHALAKLARHITTATDANCDGRVCDDGALAWATRADAE